MVRRKQIRALVERLLAEHNIESAPVNVADIAKHLKIEVQEKSTEDDLSGFLYRDRKHNRAIIGINSEHPKTRRNFTLAHELGHFLLHDFDEVHVDRQLVWLRSETSRLGTNLEEKEANLFAAELLMPNKFLKREIDKNRRLDLMDEKVIEDLAGRYGVSTQAMSFRLAYLRVID